MAAGIMSWAGEDGQQLDNAVHAALAGSAAAVEGLVVTRLDRLARSTWHLCQMDPRAHLRKKLRFHRGNNRSNTVGQPHP